MITEDWFLNHGASLKTLEGGVPCPPPSLSRPMVLCLMQKIFIFLVKQFKHNAVNKELVKNQQLNFSKILQTNNLLTLFFTIYLLFFLF